MVLATAAIDVLQIEIDARARVRAEVIALLRDFGHGGERDRAGPALEQLAGDVAGEAGGAAEAVGD
mgnify:CR=1 FL=1